MDKLKVLINKLSTTRSDLWKEITNRDNRKVDIKEDDRLEITVGANIKVKDSLILWTTIKLERNINSTDDVDSLVESAHTLVDEQFVLQLLAGLPSTLTKDK